ncbi:MAG TPA: FadR/GntR family transcriptional regulator [Gemmatimonadota bacterium]|nr:FadR/GntR family transcriptional regulator [Gemmatimonadota bacterium]
MSSEVASPGRRRPPAPDAALYGPLGRWKTTDSIVEQLEGLILDRKLAPGDFLPPERELAAALSVSRNVLREALSVLGQKGLVRVAAGRGTMVLRPSTDNVEGALSMLIEHHRISLVDLCDARLFIEPELAARAASHAEEAAIRRLDELMRVLETTREDAPAHVEADRAFHAEVARSGGNRVLAAMVQSVRQPVTRSMLLGTSVPRAIDTSDQDHRDVLEAIRRRDPDAARSAMARHISYVREYVVAHGRDLTASAPAKVGRRAV